MSHPTPDRAADAPAHSTRSREELLARIEALESHARTLEGELDRTRRWPPLSVGGAGTRPAEASAAQPIEDRSRFLQLVFQLAAELFMADDVGPFVDRVFQRISPLIGLDGYFHYRTIDRTTGRLELTAFGGIDGEVADSIRYIELGEVVCGTVARDRTPAHIEGVQHLADPKTELIRSLGVTAYACFPLMSATEVFGTFSFFRREGESYTPDELSLLGSVCHLIGMAWERARAEAALEHEREFLERLIDTIPVMVTVYDPEVREVRVNSALERVLGWTNEDARRLDLMEVCYPDPDRRQEVRAFMQSLEPGWRDFRMTARSGAVVDTTWANIRLANDTRVGIGIDISERREAEEALRDAKEAAERASDVKSRFLSTMSHELRTPLTAVLGLSDLLATGVAGPITDRQREYLTRIMGGAHHLVGIIDEILTFTRSEAGKETVHVDKVDVAEVARAVVGMLAADAETRGLQLRIDGAGEPIIVRTDRGKLRQILTNMIGNALKYTPDGGIVVELHASAHTVEFRVHDTGLGIDPDRLDEIFQPFYQVDSSNTREKGGTGLGLAICRRLARLLDGDVMADSTPGQGSTFTLRLPRAPGSCGDDSGYS